LRLPDGTRVAVPWWTPRAKRQGQRFPALLELRAAGWSGRSTRRRWCGGSGT